MKLPRVGTRVVTHGVGVDRYPQFLLPNGKLGTVAKTRFDAPNEYEVWVKMDTPFEGGQEWGHEVQIINTLPDVLEQYHAEFKPVALPWWRKVLLRWS
jgi:hypothetical protein